MSAVLRELSKKPFDLSVEGALTPQRVLKYTAESCGLKLLYGTERIDDEVIEALHELAREKNVMAKMHDMQSGAVINKIEGCPSEERRVLHTATRDFFGTPKTAFAKQAREEVDKLDVFMQKIDEEGIYNNLVLVGIGGSHLGPESCYLALERYKKPGRNVYFVNNVDPDNITSVLNNIHIERSLFVIVSKSGTTEETATNEHFIRSKLDKLDLKARKHMIAITEKGSPLDDGRKYMERFYMWDWVGGRYSSTSMVGGVLFSFAFGFDQYWEFLRGAYSMDMAALHDDLNRNVPLIAALLGVWNRTYLHYPTIAVIPYSYALRRFPAHLQQLDMESNGKSIDVHGKPPQEVSGPVVWGEPGTNAQHSFFQLLHQGTDIVPIEFIGFKLSQGGVDIAYDDTTSQEKLLSNLFAQAIALATGKRNDNPNKNFAGNRPSHILLGRKLTPSMMGALLAFYEHKVAFQGFLWTINSFDQEGVQLGKQLAKQLSNQFALKYGVHKGAEYPLGKSFIDMLEML